MTVHAEREPVYLEGSVLSLRQPHLGHDHVLALLHILALSLDDGVQEVEVLHVAAVGGQAVDKVLQDALRDLVAQLVVVAEDVLHRLGFKQLHEAKHRDIREGRKYAKGIHFEGQLKKRAKFRDFVCIIALKPTSHAGEQTVSAELFVYLFKGPVSNIWLVIFLWWKHNVQPVNALCI